MTVPNLGINLSSNDDWHTDRRWTNLANALRPWGWPGNQYTPQADLPLSPEGYPLRDVGGFMEARSYPRSGLYRYSYTGSGFLTWRAGASVDQQSRSGNAVTGSVVLDGDSGSVAFDLTGVDAANPPRDLKILLPGYGPASGPFTDDFVAMLAPFQFLRFMDWQRTNVAHPVNWSDRAQPTGQQTTDKGVAYEHVVALAQQLTARRGSPPGVWLTVPDGATADYLGQMAALFSKLPAGTAVYLELSNEVWNTTFPQYARIRKAAAANVELQASDPNQRAYELVAWQLRRAVAAFRAAFADASKVRGVIAGQAVNPWYVQSACDYLETKYGKGAATATVWGLAYADYWQPPVPPAAGALDAPGVDLEPTPDNLQRVFDGCTVSIGHDSFGWLAAYKTLGTRYGIGNVAVYEGSNGLQNRVYPTDWSPSYLSNGRLKRAAQADPRMGAMTKAAVQQFFAAGGAAYGYFASPGPWGNGEFGYWGAKEGIDASCPKWDALLAVLGAAPPPPPPPAVRKAVGVTVDVGGGVSLGAPAPSVTVLYDDGTEGPLA